MYSRRAIEQNRKDSNRTSRVLMDEVQFKIRWCPSDRVFARCVAVGIEKREQPIVDRENSTGLDVSTECVANVAETDAAEMVVRLGNPLRRLRFIFFKMDR